MFSHEIEQSGSFVYQKNPTQSPGTSLGLPNAGLPHPPKQGGRIISPLDSDQAKAVHTTLLGHYKRELSRQEDPRREMAADEDFVDHIQWTDEELLELSARGQVPVVYNVTATAIHWVLGSERRAAMDWKLLARTKDGIKHAEAKTELMKHVADVNNSQFNQSQAFRDAVIAGLGWLETGQSAQGTGTDVYDRAESWRNMLWDSTATEWDLEDARYLFRTKWLDVDMAAAMYPGRAGLIEQSSKIRLTYGNYGYDATGDEVMDSAEEAHFDHFGLVGMGEFAGRDRLRLMEGWFKRPTVVPVMKGGQFHGEIFDEWSPGHWSDVKNERASLAAVPRSVVHCAIFTESGMLDFRQSPYRHNRYPFTPVWGNRRARDRMPYGLVRGLRDINRDLNKRASKSIYILSAKRVIVEEGAVEDIEELRDEAARPDAVLVHKPGRPAPTVQTDHNLASAHMEMMAVDMNMIRDTSGVTGENLGQRTNATSGKAIIAKQEQGALTTSHYFDNLRFARKVHGEKIVVNIEQFYTKAFQFRITNTRGYPEFRDINTNPLEGDDAIALTRADFIVAEDDWRATVRQAEAEQLLDLFSKLAATAPQIVVSSLDVLVKALDVPHGDELVKRIRQITGATDPDADPNNPDPQTQEIEAAKKAAADAQGRAQNAEIALAEAKARETAAKADKLGLENLAKKRDLTGAEIQRLRDAVAAAIEIAGAQAFAQVADSVLSQAEQKAAASLMPPAPEQAQAQTMPMQQPTPQDGGTYPPQAANIHTA